MQESGYKYWGWILQASQIKMQLNKKFHVFLQTTVNMNTKELLDRIFERLKKEDCLKDFNLKRSESVIFLWQSFTYH